MRKVFACIFLLVAPLLAQSRLESGEPAATATGPSFEASLGYVYFDMAMPSQRVALGGADASALVKFNSHWGATIDSTYASTGNVLGTGHGANVLSFLAGVLHSFPCQGRSLRSRLGRCLSGRWRGPG
jgi:hypothetical protein